MVLAALFTGLLLGGYILFKIYKSIYPYGASTGGVIVQENQRATLQRTGSSSISFGGILLILFLLSVLAASYFSSLEYGNIDKPEKLDDYYEDRRVKDVYEEGNIQRVKNNISGKKVDWLYQEEKPFLQARLNTKEISQNDFSEHSKTKEIIEEIPEVKDEQNEYPIISNEKIFVQLICIGKQSEAIQVAKEYATKFEGYTIRIGVKEKEEFSTICYKILVEFDDKESAIKFKERKSEEGLIESESFLLDEDDLDKIYQF